MHEETTMSGASASRLRPWQILGLAAVLIAAAASILSSNAPFPEKLVRVEAERALPSMATVLKDESPKLKRRGRRRPGMGGPGSVRPRRFRESAARWKSGRHESVRAIRGTRARRRRRSLRVAGADGQSHRCVGCRVCGAPPSRPCKRRRGKRREMDGLAGLARSVRGLVPGAAAVPVRSAIRRVPDFVALPALDGAACTILRRRDFGKARCCSDEHCLIAPPSESKWISAKRRGIYDSGKWRRTPKRLEFGTSVPVGG